MSNVMAQQTDISSALSGANDSLFSRLNCHNIGRVINFDAEKQRADIELMQVKQFPDATDYAAILQDVPMIMYGAGGARITYPDPTGTIVLLFFIDRNIDDFLETGERYVPATSRMHDFSDCVAIPTFASDVDALLNYENDAITIIHEKLDEENDVKKETFIKTFPDHVVIKAQNIENASAEEPEITSSTIGAYNGVVELENSLGGRIEVADKIGIENTSRNMLTLMNSFLTACESIATVNGGGLTPSSKQLFTDLKTQFAELLK